MACTVILRKFVDEIISSNLENHDIIGIGRLVVCMANRRLEQIEKR